MKTELTRLLLEALKSLEGTLLPGPVDPESAVLERARDAQHGDFASNVALRLAKTAHPMNTLTRRFTRVFAAF